MRNSALILMLDTHHPTPTTTPPRLKESILQVDVWSRYLGRLLMRRWEQLLRFALNSQRCGLVSPTQQMSKEFSMPPCCQKVINVTIELWIQEWIDRFLLLPKGVHQVHGHSP